MRLKELRESKGLNMKETARLLSIPYTTYVNYEKGQREPTSEVLILLADFFDTSVDYLVGRTTSHVRTTPVHGEIVPPQFPMEPEEIELIKKYRKLDPRGQAAVLNVLEFEYSSLPGEKAHTSAKEA